MGSPTRIDYSVPFDFDFDLNAQYFLNITVTDSIAPEVVRTSLPPHNTSSTDIIDAFEIHFSEDMEPATVTGASNHRLRAAGRDGRFWPPAAAGLEVFATPFSEDMEPATVTDVANYELRAAGSDGVFGTADDHVYTFAQIDYLSGASAIAQIADGPIQPGLHRFTSTTNLTDRAGNPLASIYSQDFTITLLDGIFRIETADNDTRETATTLSLLPPGDFDRSFQENLHLQMPSNPRHLETADLTGNGEDDLVITNHGANSISIQLGNGDGTFAERVDYPVGVNPYQTVIADFNNDGSPDLAVVSESPNVITVFLNNGDGTFADPSTYSVGSNPRAIAVGDLNGDGAPDLVTANRSGNSYSVLLNNNDGTGTFADSIAVSLPGNWGPRGVALGDVTGSGNLDLVLANYTDNTVSIHLGNGDGTFAEPIVFDTGTNPESVAIGDIDGDGLADIAILPSYDSVANIFLSKGNGDFSERVDLSIGSSNTNREIRFADIDGDGRLDLLVSRSTALTIRYNTGDDEHLFGPVHGQNIGGSAYSAAPG